MAVIPPEVLQSIARRRLGLQETARGGQQRLLQDYGTDLQRLGQANTEAVQGVNDTMAGQGLFHSGIRVNEQGKVAQTYGQQLADLEQSKSRGLEDIQGALTSGLAGLNEEEARALADATRIEQERRLQQERWEAEQAARLHPPTPPSFGPDPFQAQRNREIEYMMAIDPRNRPQFDPFTPNWQFMANTPPQMQVDPGLAGILAPGGPPSQQQLVPGGRPRPQAPRNPAPRNPLSRYTRGGWRR